MNVTGAQRKRIRLIIYSSAIITILLILYNGIHSQVTLIPDSEQFSSRFETEKKKAHSVNLDSELSGTIDPTLDDDREETEDSLLANNSQSENFQLKPPSQDWIQRQVVRSLEMRGLVYSPTNKWESCGKRSYFYPKINTIFTGVPKTGCSNWIEALLRAEGELTKEINPTKVKVVHGKLSTHHRMGNKGTIAANYNSTDFSKAFSFTVVRNPWTRMVSGFRDKVSSEITQGGSFRGIGKNIVKTMRGITDPALLKDLYPTFPEFVRWLVIHQDQESGKVDVHFAPQWKTLCLPRVKYDYIVPLEYSGSLSKEIWGKINAANISLLESYDKSSDPRLQKSTLLAKEWFSDIEQETIDQLYSIYRADFALMNYRNFTDPDFPLPLHDE